MRIRELSSSIVVIGLLGSSSVFAQEAPAGGESGSTGSGETAAPAPETPAPAEQPSPVNTPAVAAAPSGGPKAVVVKMGDVGGGNSTRGAGAAAGGTFSGVGGPVTSKEDEWKFGFHGYFRAPMRIGMGQRMAAKSDQAVTTLSIPQIPSDQYLDWQYTKSVQRSWAETYLSFGNKYAKGVLGLEAFQFTESSWSNPEAQFGIGQGWVELTPDLSSIDDSLKLNAKVGTFFARYGGAGQYDAGAYDTFIGGRTHIMGETVRVDYEVNDFTWYLEEGFGTNQPNPNVNHDTKYTLLAHGHLGVNYDQFITAELHYFHAWTQEPDHACISREEEVLGATKDTNSPDTSPETASMLARFAEAPVGACKWEKTAVLTPNGKWQLRGDTPDGKLDIIAANVTINGGLAGRFFLGGNVILAKNAFTVGPAVEAVHADGGGFFKMGVTHQFLLQRDKWDAAGTGKGRFGTGRIMTLSGQYDLSISSLLEMGAPLDLQAFGMYTMIHSEDDSAMDGVTKLKYGADLSWDPVSWFGIGIRGDRVEPRSDYAQQSFTVLTPRIVFRSDYGTHEEIEIGYARYMYAQRECASFSGTGILKCAQVPGAAVAPDGFGVYPGINASKDNRGAPLDIASERGPFPDAGWDPPHENVLYISASMWW